MANLLSTNVSGRLYVSTYSDVNPTNGAFRFYDGSTFRGGLGLDSWAFSGGSSNDLNLYIANDSNLWITTNSIKRHYFNSSEAAFRTYAPDLNLKISVVGGDQFNAYYGSAATTLYLQYHGNAGGDVRIAGNKFRFDNGGHRLVIAKGSGTMISNSLMDDAIGWNDSYGIYIGSTIGGTYYIYGNGTFYDNGTIRTLIHSGNIDSQSVSYASTAGALTSMNISQFTNNSGYITGYTETDTLSTVTARGNTTNGSINVHGNILLTGPVTTTNQGRMIDFTGFDKEGTTDFSDRAYIQHTVDAGGHTGSVLIISSENDANDGIAFLTNASSKLKHNSNNLATEPWVQSQGYLTSLPSHTHDDRYYTESESDGRFQPLENQRLSTSNGPTFAEVYTNGWFRNNNINTGLYNQNTGTHFYSNSSGGFVVTGSGGTVELQFRSNHQSTLRGYVYADTSNNIGFLNNGGSWSFRTDSGTNAFIYGSDLTIGSGGANSTNIIMGDNDEGGRTIHCNSNRIGFLNQAGSWGAWSNDDGSWQTGVAMYSPIYYDSDSTGYYVDPNGTTNIWRLQANDKYHYFGSSSNWDSGSLNGENSTITNVHFQGHPDFWIGAGNTKWYTGVISGHHDLLINTMQSGGSNTRGITFTATSSGASAYRLGRWFAHSNQAGSYLQVDGGVKIGGTSDYYSAPTAKLLVTGSTSGADVLAVDGINGRLFSVTDDLSDSLFSVNTIAGLPVIEAFADNTVKIGKYGSNSITISNSKIAINSDTVDANFPFYVGDRSTSGARYILANPGMGFNLADNYAQLQLYGTAGGYIDFVSSAIDSGGRIFWNGNFTISGDTYFNNSLYTYTLYDRNDTGYYLDMNGTSRLGTINANELRSYGNTYLGDGNGDETHINDVLRIGATDSGDAHIFFGEGGSAGSDYGAHLYWDSGYTFTWYTRNAGSDTALFNYVTNDTTYLNWSRHFNMQNREINYVSQLHFNSNTRFINSSANYLYLNFGSDSHGSIQVRDNSNNLKGYLGYFDSSGFGLLNSSGNWGIRLAPGNAEAELFYAGTWRVRTGSAGIGVNGNVYIDQDYGFGIVGLYDSYRYQGIFAMGDAYKLAANGQSTGNLYGLAWTHTNVGGQSKAGLEHQLLVMNYGTTLTAIGNGIWTAGTITTVNHGNSSQWNSAYGWGNHASANYIVRGSTQAPGAWPDATKFKSTGDIGTDTSSNHSLQIYADEGTDAFMAFHISNDYAVFFGLENDTNRLYTGGWSLGNIKHQIWDTRDFTSTNVSNWNTAYGWGNHASQGYITTNGRAYPRRADGTNINFYWDGQGGQPTWLWGSNNGVDFYVWNPSNFSVNYAASAGTATSATSATTASSATYATSAGSALEVVRTVDAGVEANVVSATIGDNDFFRIRTGGGSNAGFVEIATADDGTEPIYVRQYTGVFSSLTRTATILDGSGNTNFPNTVYAAAYRGNANVGGTGEATWHPAGAYIGSTMWQYGAQYKNNTGIYGLLELQLNSGFTISQTGSNALMSGWLKFGGYGIYSDTNSAHFYPNDYSYGAWRITGTRNGWNGLHFGGANGITLMMNEGEFGFHREAVGWVARFTSGYFHGTAAEAGYASSAGYASEAGGAGYATSAGSASTANYATDAGYASSSGYATTANRLERYGIIYGDNWNSYNQNNRLLAISAHNHTGSNRPTTAYTYGSGLSYYNSGSDHYQFFFPENGGSSNANNYKIHYRSGWNDSWGGWRTLIDLYNSVCYVDGAITATGDITAYSDARVKENVNTLENALDKTLSLRGVSYNRTDIEDKSTKIGFIAQELLEVVPEVVTEDESGMYGVSYGNVTALLVEAIKEQQKQIEELKLEIQKLKSI